MGSVGDYFGGITNPILSFLAFVGVLWTLHYQREDLKTSREELQIQVNELKQQRILDENREQIKATKEQIRHIQAPLAQMIGKKLTYPPGSRPGDRRSVSVVDRGGLSPEEFRLSFLHEKHWLNKDFIHVPVGAITLQDTLSRLKENNIDMGVFAVDLYQYKKNLEVVRDLIPPDKKEALAAIDWILTQTNATEQEHPYRHHPARCPPW